MKKYWHIIVGATIISIGLIILVVSAWQNSATADENNHLAAGVIYVQENNFTWNPAHPPLVKILAGLPLVLSHQAKADPTIVAEHSTDMRGMYTRVLYDKPGLIRPQFLFFWGRLPMLMFWLLMAILLWWWPTKRWGKLAGLLTLAVFVFDPSFLGHGNLINTDVPVTALTLAVVFAAENYFNNPKRKNLLWLAIIFAITQIIKFSAVYLWPILFGLGIIKIWLSHGQYRWRQWWIMVGTVTAVTAVMIWASYGFEVRRFIPNEITSPKIAAVAKHIKFPLPAVSYIKGLSDVLRHNNVGHETYLNGKAGQHGWWYYFPEAIGLKTPALTLVLFAAWLVIGTINIVRSIRRAGWRWPPFSVWLFGIPPLVYLATSMTSHINIGLRHVFPIYPFIYLAIGSLVSWSVVKKFRWYGIVVAALIVSSAVVTWRAWPNTISYFNLFAGGSSNGQKYLMDSNLDWGQDVWRLQRFLDQQQFARVRVWVYGSIPPSAIWPRKKPMLLDKDIAAGSVLNDVIIVSKDNLYDPNGRIKYLLPYKPRWIIGTTILVYDFRSGQIN